MIPAGGADTAPDETWETKPVRGEGSQAADDDGPDGPVFTVDVEGFEGPLDLLLALARTQKVDLARLSVVALADQYLAFIAEARRMRLEVAGDYLVMAAWLTYLKSRLLLPREDTAEDQAPAEELARRLAFRLARLDAMRTAAAHLMARPRLGIDQFPRGLLEQTRTHTETTWRADILDLMRAYADRRRATTKVVHTVRARRVWSIKDARVRLERLIGRAPLDWRQLDLFLADVAPAPEDERTAKASAFGASLEMAREGLVELRQEAPFAPIYMRRRDAAEWQRIGAGREAS
ncbi:MAG: ScpA family protein [Hyphomicrobiaceae bacterium]|nr:ScpA family protein [Hyphomicrobiaceae bacterium]